MIIGYPNRLLPLVIHKMFIKCLRDSQENKSHILSFSHFILLNTYYAPGISLNKPNKGPALTEFIFYAVGIKGGREGSRE